VTIHTGDPFKPERGSPNELRRLRARLPAAVSIWAAGSGRERTGLTVSSMLVADGEPGYVVGLLKPETDLVDALSPGSRFTVSVLRYRHRQLAEMFAGLAPAPGGMFGYGEWRQESHGPVLVDATASASCTVDGPAIPTGYGALLRAAVDEIDMVDVSGEATAGDDTDDRPLTYHRGSYGWVSGP
jgi:flavin reductase (DIM6/NTAB) family NADH-FMN oxidoreductase RutF